MLRQEEPQSAPPKRRRSSNSSTSNLNTNNNEDNGAGTCSTSRRRPIQDVRYDYYSRPIIQSENSDGNWEVSNPVDTTTGLWYDPIKASSSSGASASSGEANTTAAADCDGADWYDMMQLFLRHGYKSALRNSRPEDHPLLLVERSYNPPPVRQQALECLFEEMNAPATFLAKDAVLACYATGRTTSTVVDIGYGGTTVTPVYEGYVEPKGIRRNPTGLLQMDSLVLEQLDTLYKNKKRSAAPGGVMPLYQVRRQPGHEPRSPDFHKAARLYLACQCREAGAGAAINTADSAAAAAAAASVSGENTAKTTTSSFHAPNKPFELPDGTVLNIPSANRFAAADLLFGSDAASVQRRERVLEQHTKRLGEIVAHAESLPSSSKQQQQQEGEQEESKYTERTAVGISSRRRKRGTAKAAAASTKKQQQKTDNVFSNRLLQKACAPYLQTHLVDHLTNASVASMVCDAAYRCDRDQQASLMGNVVLSGGGSCLGPTDQAVTDLLREQVEAMIHTHTPGWRVKILAPGRQDRAHLSWLGGSILGSLGTFHDMWITKAEYEEWGSAIVNRKCP